MRVDEVIVAVMAHLVADPELVNALGGEHIFRYSANREPQVPSLEYLRVSNAEGENTEEVLIQFDIWGKGAANAMAIERRVRALPSRQPKVIGGILMKCSYEDSRDHDDPDAGVAHHSVDLRFETALAPEE